MSPRRPKTAPGRIDRVLAEAQRERQIRLAGYRDQALKIFAWVCGRCGREFSGKKLRELTVHHKDHNHDNNPPDGSNWELLCIYCHDMEHCRYQDEEDWEGTGGSRQEPFPDNKPFAALKDLLADKE
ncbi:MAG: YajD family HNH nuclease [Thermodesulfobacteriota bacterium]